MSQRISLLLVFLAGLVPAQIKMPPFERMKLDNGVTLVLMPKKELPLLTIATTVRGGSEADPEGLDGLADVTGEMLLRGTETRSRDQIAESLDRLGATLRVQTGPHSSAMLLEVLAKNATPALGLLEDLLRHPAFPEKESAQYLRQRLDAAKAIKDNPQAAIDPYYLSFFYGKSHPYGRFPGGNEQSIARITRAGMQEFWKKQYVGQNLFVVVAGDFEPARLGPKLKEMFGAIPAGTAYAYKTAAPVKVSAPRLLLIDKPDATQTYFRIGMPGISATTPERTAIELVNTLFGGRFTSMLNDALRVESGLTYGANSRATDDRLPGSIYIGTFTKTESTEAAIDLALKQLDKLRADGINAEQLASAKAYVKGTYPPRRLETTDQLASMLTLIDINGWNRGEVDDFVSRLDAVTLEQANAAARKFYQRENLTFVLIGDAFQIKQAVKKYAPSIVEKKITEPGF